MSYTSERTKKREKELAALRAKAPGAWDGGSYREALDSALKSLLERERFSYDPGADPLYQTARDNYTTRGKRAMEDTMGRAAALTGGYANSYAATAGAQAYGDMLQGLGEELPGLYALAMDRYRAEGEKLAAEYELLAGENQMEYQTWLSEQEAWQSELDELAAALESSREQDYQEYRDGVRDAQWQAEFDEDRRRYQEEKAAAAQKNSSSGASRSKSKAKSETETKRSGLSDIPTERLAGLKSMAAGGRHRLVEELNRLQESYHLSESEYRRLYSTYYPYTPEARESAYAGQTGATGYYV